MMRTGAVREGMEVSTADGQRLGRVVLTGHSEFQIEKGSFFPKEFVACYADVAEVQGQKVVLGLTLEELRQGKRAPGTGAAPPERAETEEPLDPAERRRLQEQLDTAREAQLQGPRMSIRRDSVRLGPARGGRGSVVERHEEHAIGPAEDGRHVVSRETSRTFRVSGTRHEERRAKAPVEGAERQGVAPDAGSTRGDPNEHP